MKESYRENLASSSGLKPYAGDGNIEGVASVRGGADQPLSSEIKALACRSRSVREKAKSDAPPRARLSRTRRSRRPCASLCMCQSSKGENREIPSLSTRSWGRSTNLDYNAVDFEALAENQT
jgi:hypothetical protein